MNEQGTLPVIPEGKAGRIYAAAERTIRAKYGAQLLTDDHALTVEMILGMARAVDQGLQFGKVSTATTTMLKELREALASLPQGESQGGSEWDQIQADLA